MSDPRYAPYGADDDPFLTHPAGPGQRDYGRAAPREYWQSESAVQQWQSDWTRVQGGHTAPQPHSPYAETGYPAQGYGWNDDPYQRDAGLGPYAELPYQPPSQGNYRPRGAAPSAQIAHQQAEARPAHMQGRQGQSQPQPAAWPQSEPPRYQGQPEHSAPMPAAPRLAAQPRYAQPNAAQHRAHAAGLVAQPRDVPRAAFRGQDAYGASPQGHPAAKPHPSAAPYAQAPYDGRQGEGAHTFAPRLPMAGQVLHWAGALCSVLAVVGLGIWGYDLAMRDAYGIPVVQAAEGPLRKLPSDAGGDVSANQGLAVNSIPASGLTAPIPDEITLAPQDTSLASADTAQDGAQGLIEEGSFAAAAPSGEGGAATLAGASDQLLHQPQADGGLGADLSSLPDALPEDMPLTDAEAVERALADALAEGDVAGFADEPATMAATDPVAPPTAEIDPASLAKGTLMAQFGVFDSAELARAEWANLQTRFTRLLAGKSLVLEQAKSGGSYFYRLRAHGFDTYEDSRRFCIAIKAERGECKPVVQD